MHSLKAKTSEPTLFPVGHAYVGNQGAKELLEVLLQEPPMRQGKPKLTNEEVTRKSEVDKHDKSSAAVGSQSDEPSATHKRLLGNGGLRQGAEYQRNVKGTARASHESGRG
jgi:hypothetical protein